LIFIRGSVELKPSTLDYESGFKQTARDIEAKNRTERGSVKKWKEHQGIS
jgi:hypothetical protein